MSKPRLLDLFCGAGGAAVGYSRAGFEVVGVDHKPQPHYPFEFMQADALQLLSEWDADEVWEWSFAAIHASPPCQAYSVLQGMSNANPDHPELIAPTRELLIATGLPYVIENVAGSRKALIDPVLICGSAVGLPIRRHRLFETNFPLLVPRCQHGVEGDRQYPSPTRPWQKSRVVQVFGSGGGSKARPVELWREAMDCPWMTKPELAQAIPPAYTELIGHQLLAHVQARAAA